MFVTNKKGIGLHKCRMHIIAGHTILGSMHDRDITLHAQYTHPGYYVHILCVMHPNAALIGSATDCIPNGAHLQNNDSLLFLGRSTLPFSVRVRAK